MIFSRTYVESLLGEILCTFSGIFTIKAEFTEFCMDGYFSGDIELHEDIQDFIRDRVPVSMYVHFNEIPDPKVNIFDKAKCTVHNGVCVCTWNEEEEHGKNDKVCSLQG